MYLILTIIPLESQESLLVNVFLLVCKQNQKKLQMICPL